jgi:TldD protein
MSGVLLDRREFVGLGMGLCAATAAEALLGCSGSRREVKTMPTTNAIHYFAAFGVDERLLRESLAEAMGHGGDRADVFVQHRVVNSLVLEDGEVNRAFTSVSLGAGVRVVKGDQQGYAYTEELTLASLKRAAQTAAAVAEGAAREVPGAFRVGEIPARYPLKTRWEEVRVDRKLPVLTGVNAATLAADARIKKVTVTFADETGAILVADSDGRLVEDLQPMTRISVQCMAEQDGRREQNGWNVAARDGFDWYTQERLDRLVKRTVARTVVLFDAVPAPVGEMPVVLGAGASGILLHEAIGHGMEADFNRKNESIFSDRLGKPVAQPFVSIVDDGTEPHARGSINVDDEGNAVGRTTLVENGVLTSYLHDSISAAHYKVKPTGNGRRESYQHVPQPRMRSTYMLPGPHKKEEIIASVKKGIYCDGFSNGQVNIGPGDFTFYVTNGFLIEDGKLTRPVKDVNIIGNGPKVLEKIDMVADDLQIDEGGWTCGKGGQSVPVSQGLPTVRVSSITVGGRQS